MIRGGINHSRGLQKGSGPPILVVASAFVGYVIGYSLKRIIYILYTLEEVSSADRGLFNVYCPIYHLSLFSGESNIGTFLLILPMPLTGRTTGGPAKVAVISSALGCTPQFGGEHRWFGQYHDPDDEKDRI